MTKLDDLVSFLRSNQVDADELAQVFLEFFGAAAYESASEVIYHRPGDLPAVHFFYNGDQLETITAGPGLSSSDILTVQGKITTDLLDLSRKIVGRQILFSAYPVTGYLKIGDCFQICPVPQSAPRPKDLWEGNHPLLIEFEVPDSPNLMIRANRVTARAQHFSLLLNAIAEGSIKSASSSQHYRWVIADIAGPRYEHLRDGYGFQDFQPWQESFTDCAVSPPIDLVDHHDYFKRIGHHLGRPFQLPNTFEQLFNTYLQLKTPMQEKFTRAAFWYKLSQNQESSSALFMHLIQCIETLLPPAEGGRVCPECNRHIGKGPTQRFTDFLDELVPAHLELAKGRKHLYKLRSDLSHGWDLFARDLKTAMNPKSSDQMLRILDAYQLARIALINWLIKQAPQQPTPQASSVVPPA